MERETILSAEAGLGEKVGPEGNGRSSFYTLRLFTKSHSHVLQTKDALVVLDVRSFHSRTTPVHSTPASLKGCSQLPA
eukprot:5810766-Amphidinium_carterae.2